jgi:hypothetical protein
MTTVLAGSRVALVRRSRRLNCFLKLVRPEVLSHDVMTSEDMRVRVYGDTAVTVSRGISGGTYQGQPFWEEERVSCVFVREEGRWQCVLTHVSRLAPADAT